MNKKNKHPQKKAPFFKCKLCGELIKVTRWRKHLVINHHIGKLIKYQDYFTDDVKKKCRCNLCSKIYPKIGWRDHLLLKHKIGNDIEFRDYYISNHNTENQTNKTVIRKVSSLKKDWRCGDILNGPPKTSIIYNAVCTNRRKH